MFLDSLSKDGSWLGRYALDRDGSPIPWTVVEQMHKDTHPYEVFMVRQQLLGIGSTIKHHICYSKSTIGPAFQVLQKQQA